jgi:hypothetical protein
MNAINLLGFLLLGLSLPPMDSPGADLHNPHRVRRSTISQQWSNRDLENFVPPIRWRHH